MTQEIDCKVLTNSLLGRDLDQDECSILASRMGTRQLQDGEDLVREGDTSRTLFILASGRVGVHSVVGGNDVNLYTMHIGESAGMGAFLEQAPRMATLRAEEASTVYTLEPDDLEALLDTEPRIVYKFMRGLFRQTHANLMRVDAESQQLSNYISKMGGRY